MADYTEIKGNRIQYLDSDPTLTSDTEGQVWYNTTTGTLKGLVQFKAWISGGNMNTARYSVAGAGTQTAALGFGGYTTTRLATTEEYDGSAWTAGGNLGTATYNFSGAGTQTAGLQVGGNIGPPAIQSTDTEEYDGSAWTAGGSLTNGRNSHSAAGTQTAGLTFGGAGPGGGITTATEEYDGSAWTAGGALSTATQFLSGGGVQTAALKTAGRNPPSVYKTDSEEYDGTSWTTGGNLNNARFVAASNIGGAQDNALIAGGFIGSGPPAPRTTQSEEYDGSAWSIGESMATAKSNQGQAGSRSAAVGFAGYSTSPLNTTEEYNSVLNPTIPAAFSSAPAFSTQRGSSAPFSGGTQTAYGIFGGDNPPVASSLADTEEYDGSAWTTGGSLPTATNSMGGAGTQTSGLGNDGNIGAPYPAGQSPRTYEYDGTSWTDVGSGRGTIATYGFSSETTGTQTAALGTGGYTAGAAPSDEYNGSTWTTGGAIIDNDPSPSNNQIYSHSVVGTQTAALLSHGTSHSPSSNPANYLSETQLYNGTSWTNAPATVNRVTVGSIAFGNQTAAIYAGGSERPSGPSGGGVISQSQTWDGTSWAAGPNTGTASQYNSAGNTSAGVISTGRNIAGNNTEEWNEATLSPTTTASTLTTS